MASGTTGSPLFTTAYLVLMGDLKLPSIAIKVVPCLGAARLLAYHAASHCSTRLSRHKSSRFVILKK